MMLRASFFPFQFYRVFVRINFLPRFFELVVISTTPIIFSSSFALLIYLFKKNHYKHFGRHTFLSKTYFFHKNKNVIIRVLKLLIEYIY